MAKIPVKRLPIRLDPDPRRTIIRFFWPGPERAIKIIKRVDSLNPNEVSELTNDVLQQFTAGNPGLTEILIEHYKQAIYQTDLSFNKDLEVQLLTGAYFSMEYAFESAALFNPSIVPGLDQPDLSKGTLHFGMSLRSVGEGHLSSITFRRGTINRQGEVEIIPAGLEVRQSKINENRTFKKDSFVDKLNGLQIWNEQTKQILDDLSEVFSTFEI